MGNHHFGRQLHMDVTEVQIEALHGNTTLFKSLHAKKRKYHFGK